MKLKAKYIITRPSGVSVFQDDEGNSYLYRGQFRLRKEGETASIEVDRFGSVSSVQFESQIS